jgi:dTDP-4-amino-4,6-dideoxygalactose transaminase
LFEEEFRSAIGCEHALAVSSCTAALHLALVANHIGRGDEIIVPTMTFAASAEVSFYTGARPVFCDIETETFNIDPAKIEEKITPRTKAIVAVHYAGHPCDMDAIQRIADENGLKVIEDAAHALPAKYHGKTIGNLGNITCFSFYATKNLATGEGGMLTTNDDDVMEMMKVMSLHGISKDAWKRYSSEGSWYYEIMHAGFKYNFTDIQASIGLHQLRKLNARQKRRHELLKIYNDELGDVKEIRLPVEKKGVESAWHLFPVLIRPEQLSIDRNQFIEELRTRNIGSSVHFIPLHLHPFYKEMCGTKEGDCPNSEYVYQREITLPLYPRMTDDDCLDVAYAVRQIINENRK